MATKKCVICSQDLNEEYGKLKGTIIKAKNEKNKNEFTYLCSNCQKDKENIKKIKEKEV
jgi:hypothetical protein